MTRGEPQWGIYYKDDTYPETYAFPYQQAIDELWKHGDLVSLMVWYNGDWKEFIEYD
jgi:hypothetical protein